MFELNLSLIIDQNHMAEFKTICSNANLSKGNKGVAFLSTTKPLLNGL